MSNEVTGRPAGDQHTGQFESTSEFGHGGPLDIKQGSDTAPLRAARAKLIEETTYRLTDLFTIVSARLELLSDRVPAPCREELASIRKILLHGVELNKRLYLVAEAYRRGAGVHK